MIDMVAIRHAAMIFAPRTFMRVTKQVWAGDTMVVA
jgi:hypothetical protein